MMGISVIICCYNSALRIPTTLQHLAVQVTTNLKWEIIIVDNASLDNTAAKAEEIARDLALNNFKVVSELRPGLTNARMRGVAEAKYDIILFCDDDNWLSSTYLQEAYKIMQSDLLIGAAGGIGKAVSDVAFPSWFERYRGYYACYEQGGNEGQLMDPRSFLFGAGMVVRKKVFETLRVRGFEPVLSDRVGKSLSSGGDTELSYAIRIVGYKLWYSPFLVFEHFIPGSRLNTSYLVKLTTSIAVSTGLLTSYIYVLQNKSVDRTVWLKDLLYQSYFVTRATYCTLFSGRLDDRITFQSSYARLMTLFSQFGRYHRQYRKVKQLQFDAGTFQ